MTRFWGLVGGGRGWSVFAKPRGFLSSLLKIEA